MDLQTILKNAGTAARADEMKTSDQLTLGEMILKLEVIADKTKQVSFEFEYLHPTDFDSYRGIYAELAIGFDAEGSAPTVAQFLEKAKQCLGKTFEGYKGGDFVMGKTTPVWVANYGNSGRTAVVDVIDDEYDVRLRVAQMP